MTKKKKISSVDKVIMFAIGCLILVAIFNISYKMSTIDSPENVIKRETIIEDRAVRQASEFKEKLSAMQYFRDVETNNCFSYVWMGMANGGPSMTNVPCDGLTIDVEFDTGS